jgi:hypothetical protein
MREDILIMSQKEIKRLQIIQKVLGKEINQQEAAEVLRISDRQVRRVDRASAARTGRKSKDRSNDKKSDY